MTFPHPGASFVPEYQVSGMPWAINNASTGRIRFPYLTQWFYLRTADMVSAKFAFTEAGLNGSNSFNLVAADGIIGPFHLRVPELWISAAAMQIVAGLTTIKPSQLSYTNLSGSARGNVAFHPGLGP